MAVAGEVVVAEEVVAVAVEPGVQAVPAAVPIRRILGLPVERYCCSMALKI